jgi:cytochrome c5
VETCGGRYVARVEDGVYEVTCERCHTTPATGPALDVHWAAQFWRGQTCGRVLNSTD